MTDPSPEDRAIPEDWHEVGSPDYIVEKYDPRVPTLFEHEGHDVGVHVLPDEPIAPHADTEAWRVGVVRGDHTDLDGVDPFAHCESREAALHVAHEFMSAFDDHEEFPEERRIQRAEERAGGSEERAGEEGA